MSDLQRECYESFLKEVYHYSDKRSLMLDETDNSLWQKKTLSNYQIKVYEFLKNNQHQYIAKIRDYYQKGDELVVYEENVNGQRLSDLIVENSLDEETKLKIYKEVLEAVSFFT